MIEWNGYLLSPVWAPAETGDGQLKGGGQEDLVEVLLIDLKTPRHAKRFLMEWDETEWERSEDEVLAAENGLIHHETRAWLVDNFEEDWRDAAEQHRGFEIAHAAGASWEYPE